MLFLTQDVIKHCRQQPNRLPCSGSLSTACPAQPDAIKNVAGALTHRGGILQGSWQGEAPQTHCEGADGEILGPELALTKHAAVPQGCWHGGHQRRKVKLLLQARLSRCRKISSVDGNIVSTVLSHYVTTLSASPLYPAPSGKIAALRKKPIAGFPGSCNKQDGVLPAITPAG